MQKKVEKTSKKEDFSNPTNPELEKFRFLLQNITEEYLNKFQEIQGTVRKDAIPVNIFNKKLSPLETVVKYLKENLDLTLKQASKQLNRSQKTIWQAYKNSKKKMPNRFQEKHSQYFIPIKNLSDRHFSILELVVSYLKETYSINYHDLGAILSRDERTIWTVYQRARKKRSK